MSRFRLPMGFCLAVLAISLIFVGVQDPGPSAAAADPQPNARAVARVMEVQDRNTARLMAIKGVVGTATGLDAAGQPVVKVFLAKGGVAGIPAKLEGVPVAVEVTGVFVALKPPVDKPGKRAKPPKDDIDPTARFDRPVPIGVSTGHPDITAGTIGCRVTDGTNVYALSNNHIYADCNEANIGDNALQPGAYDGGVDPGDAIGTLAAFKPIVFSTDGGNVIDAAIALSSTANLGNATPTDGYGKPSSTTVTAYVGQTVKKYGRTTSLTKGNVTEINATVLVGYGDQTAQFVGQIVVKSPRFSKGGDSGSLVVVDDDGGDDDLKPVGLLFAGGGNRTICNPIGLVLGEFGVTIDGE